MSDAWQYITPETKKFRKNKDGETTAIRAKWFNDQVNQQKVNKTGFGGSSRWSFKSFILLAPWSSIVSWAFIISGLVIYSLNASKVSDRTRNLLNMTEIHVYPYNTYLETILSSDIISSILGGVSVIVGAVAAWIHIRGVLEGLRWRSVTKFILKSCLIIGLLYLFACISWFFIIANYLSSWCTGLWILESSSGKAAVAMDGKSGTVQDCLPECLNLQNFPFFNTSACICDHQGLVNIHQMAASTRVKAIWLLVGVMCIVVGLSISLINVSADVGCLHMLCIPELAKGRSKQQGMMDDNEEIQKSTIKLPSITPGSVQARSRMPV